MGDEINNPENIKCIINCTYDLPFINDNNIVKKRIPVNDDLSYEANICMLKYIKNIINLIHNNLLNNINTLVHCYAGKQRSATVILLYLMKYAKLNKEICIKLIQTKRPDAFTPGINFDYAITNFK